MAKNINVGSKIKSTEQEVLVLLEKRQNILIVTYQNQYLFFRVS